MKASDVHSSEYNPYYENYIKQSGNKELIAGLKDSLERTQSFLKSIDLDKLEYRYAEGKWTIKEIVLHLIDTERVFIYRAMRFARHDKTELPGFDQDVFVEHSGANKRSIENLLSEYNAVRKATISTLENFTDDMLSVIGEASGSGMSARAAGFIIIGHETHHCNVVRERYL